MLAGVGAWYAKEEEQDPETTAVIATKVNIPGLVTAGTGLLGIFLGIFQQKQHSDQATLAVAVAAAAPPCDHNGACSVKHTLNTALTQSSQEKDFEAATKILELLKNLEVKS